MSADEACTASGERVGAGGDPTLDRGSGDGPGPTWSPGCRRGTPRNARDLPWRRPDASAWGVLVSEFMLQQTPVSRVLPVYESWLARWPTAAGARCGAARRGGAGLGPARLPASRAAAARGRATMITEQHAGRVPDDPVALRALPGVGDYTAAAVAAFAYRPPHGRARHQRAPGAGPGAARRGAAGHVGTRSCRARGRRDAAAGRSRCTAATWSVAAMELGRPGLHRPQPRLRRVPGGARVPLAGAGRPPGSPPRRSQTYAGTDRQVRGLLLAVLRDSRQSGPAPGPGPGLARPGAARARPRRAWWPTGWSSPSAADAFALPGTHRPA